MLLEIACFNLESCLAAQQASADRIELCENYAAGGVTPADELIIAARSRITLPVHVMVRPREGNFVYSETEFEQMKRSIRFCGQHGIDGVVFGILTTDGSVNERACKELIQLAGPMTCVFHRAIDQCADLDAGLHALIGCGFSGVLSAGGKQTADEGALMLRKLVEAFGQRIEIIAGGGIRSSNILSLAIETGAGSFHSAALLDGSSTADLHEIRTMRAELDRLHENRL